MKINSIKINNFRSYKGLTTFDFRMEKDKNIILVGGENGAGKSSIFEAIRLCIYGPLAYKYQGMVANYIARIKSMINEDAYSDKDVEAYIELDINLTNKTMEENYILRRQWSFDNSRLKEEFIVIESGNKLSKVETEQFHEYFKTVVPPAIFELSFFDGEKLFDFFEDRISGSKLKETILILNNIDIFNILSRELELNTRRKNKERANLEVEALELESLESSISKKREEKNRINSIIMELLEEIDKLEIMRNAKNKEFINAGGLNQEERERLINEISKCESERDKINLDIKSFSNDMLPFIIVMKELKELESQLYNEQEFLVYETIKDRLDIRSIKFNLEDKNLCSDNLDVLIKEITSMILPNKLDPDFKPIHYLSKEQLNKVISKINAVSKIDIKETNYFNEIQSLTEKIAFNRSKLRSSMDMNEEKKYIEEIENMNLELNNKYISHEAYKSKKDILEKEIDIDQRNLLKINEKIELIKKADNIKDISDVIIKMTEELVNKVISSKRKELERYFVQIFYSLIRKDKFIDYIDIDEKFNVDLYVRKRFTVREVVHIIMNLGMWELKEKQGNKFLEDIVGDSDISKNELLNYLNKLGDDKILNLSTKIDVMNLSSGEKQIYILCLY